MSARRGMAAVMLAMLLTSCGTGVYTSQKFAFSAVCPDGWTVSEDAYSACFGTPAESEDDDFYENVIYAGAEELNGSLEEYVLSLSNAIAENSANFTEISRETTTVSNYEAVIFTYTCTSSQTAYVIWQRMYLLSDGKYVYNLVYTANEESFDRYAENAAAIAESFQAK